MSEPRRKSPRLKKLDEYDREYRTIMENPHAFRRNWPKKKARANRCERVKVRAVIASTPVDDLTAGAMRSAVKRHAVHKSDVMTVRDFLRHKAARRAMRASGAARSPSL